MSPLERAMKDVELLTKSRTCSNCVNQNCPSKSNCIRRGGFSSRWLGEPGRDYEKEYLMEYWLTHTTPQAGAI